MRQNRVGRLSAKASGQLCTSRLEFSRHTKSAKPPLAIWAARTHGWSLRWIEAKGAPSEVDVGEGALKVESDGEGAPTGGS